MTAGSSLLFFSHAAHGLMSPLEEFADAPVLEAAQDDEALTAELSRNTQVIVAIGYDRLDAARLDSFPQLRQITVMGVGHDGIDMEAAKARGIAVTNTQGANTDDVADHAAALWLASRREILRGDRHVRSGKWTEGRLPLSRSVGADKVGIVGLGLIGAAIGRRAEAFGCPVAWWGRTAKPDAPWPPYPSLEALAEWADTLFVALPGGDDTMGLVDSAVLAALGPGGLLVNIGRGTVVDQPALEAALRDGRLGSAALDVYEHEPFDGPGLVDLDSVVLTPHVGGATDRAFERLRAMALESVRAFIAGRPVPHRLI